MAAQSATLLQYYSNCRRHNLIFLAAKQLSRDYSRVINRPGAPSGVGNRVGGVAVVG